VDGVWWNIGASSGVLYLFVCVCFPFSLLALVGVPVIGCKDFRRDFGAARRVLYRFGYSKHIYRFI
jgi:hypothetical protein